MIFNIQASYRWCTMSKCCTRVLHVIVIRSVYLYGCLFSLLGTMMVV